MIWAQRSSGRWAAAFGPEAGWHREAGRSRRDRGLSPRRAAWAPAQIDGPHPEPANRATRVERRPFGAPPEVRTVRMGPSRLAPQAIRPAARSPASRSAATRSTVPRSAPPHHSPAPLPASPHQEHPHNPHTNSVDPSTVQRTGPPRRIPRSPEIVHCEITIGPYQCPGVQPELAPEHRSWHDHPAPIPHIRTSSQPSHCCEAPFSEATSPRRAPPHIL